MFPSHARHPAIGSTPSSGKAEVMRALACTDPRRHGVTPTRVSQHLQAGRERPAAADVKTVLDAISASLVTASGGKYSLTRTGLKAARRQRPRAIGAYGY